MFVCPECGLVVAQAGACPNDGTALAARGDDGLIGTTVGPYRVARLLGVGGMGRVYKGVHPTIGSRVAVKVLSHECAERPELVERFFSEARAVNLIRHEGIVNVLDLERLPDGRPFIIMEYLDGAALADVIKDTGPLPLGGLARLAAEVLDALAAAHGKGIVHRDLKPDNIYVTPAGHPRVLDFGIAKLRPEQGGSYTQTGSLLGTPHYMSPEQATGRPVDFRTDLYAMGVILFECATGRKPFDAPALFDLLRQHLEQPPPSPRALRPDMPVELEQVIVRALAKDPSQRFASAAEMAHAIAAACATLPNEQWAQVVPSTIQGAVRTPFASMPPRTPLPASIAPASGAPATAVVRSKGLGTGAWIGLGVLVVGAAVAITIAAMSGGGGGGGTSTTAAAAPAPAPAATAPAAAPVAEKPAAAAPAAPSVAQATPPAPPPAPAPAPPAPPPPKPTDDRSTGAADVAREVAAMVKRGCRVINDARTVDDVLTISDWQIPAGACTTIVAATGVDGNTLTIQFFDDAKQLLGEPTEGKQLSKVFCSKQTANYGYQIAPSLKMPFTSEELQCGK